jgi:hypothetical protein
MEEQQIQEFVYRVSHNEALRQELTSDPEAVIERERFSPGVAKIVARLVPHLTLMQPLNEGPASWWQ